MCDGGVRVCVCVCGGAYRSINSNLLRNSQPAVQLLLSMSSALRYFHDVNSVVTD